VPRYLFRLDDLTPTTDRRRLAACLALFAEFGVKPILGVVPDNRDPLLEKDPAGPGFWETILRLAEEKRATIAQHGLHHVYHRHPGALLRKYGGDDLTEFAGLSYREQLEKIGRGRGLLAARGLDTALWMAPNHSYDRATLRALADSGFTALTDGVGLYPFKRDGLAFVPVLTGKPRRVPCGLATVCLHPNTMTETDFRRLRSFLDRSPRTISFEDALSVRPPCYAGLVNVLCRIAFFLTKNGLRVFRMLSASRRTRA
jgi:predicted deacetylase